MVEQMIKTFTSVFLEGNAAAYLLHDTPLTIARYTNSLSKHLFNAAKACIPTLWKNLHPPHKITLAARNAEMQQIENLTMVMKDQEEKYWTWIPCFYYRNQTR